MANIGTNVNPLRRAKNLTQADLAEKLHVNTCCHDVFKLALY